MGDSGVGYVLTLIGGIVTLVFSVVLLLASVVLFSGGSVLEEFLGAFTIPVTILGFVFLFVFIVSVLIGVLKISAARMMRSPRKTLRGGIFALILGVITSDPFSLIGGIFGIVQGSS